MRKGSNNQNYWLTCCYKCNWLLLLLLINLIKNNIWWIIKNEYNNHIDVLILCITTCYIIYNNEFICIISILIKIKININIKNITGQKYVNRQKCTKINNKTVKKLFLIKKHRFLMPNNIICYLWLAISSTPFCACFKYLSSVALCVFSIIFCCLNDPTRARTVLTAVSNTIIYII